MIRIKCTNVELYNLGLGLLYLLKLFTFPLEPIENMKKSLCHKMKTALHSNAERHSSIQDPFVLFSILSMF